MQKFYITLIPQNLQTRTLENVAYTNHAFCTKYGIITWSYLHKRFLFSKIQTVFIHYYVFYLFGNIQNSVPH